MNFVLFYHSLLSDWNHGNAHFLRGIATELLSRGHCVDIYEPADGWSLNSLLNEHGHAVLGEFRAHYPALASHLYTVDALDLDQALEAADVVLVHEWNPPALIERIGRHAANNRYKLFFHDTHHRCISDPDSMARLDLRHYHGVLAFGRTIAEQYLQRGWTARAWTWHEAADTCRFKPLLPAARQGDLIWIGNWGDDERSAELHEFLISPVKALGLKAKIYGVRYPAAALQALRDAGIEYAGWIANFRVPEMFARYRCTVHVPRRTYADTLLGIPTIRMFEALACGIPLISAPWHDTEGLFNPGVDYLVAADGVAMRQQLRRVLNDADLARALAAQGLQTVLSRHTCRHRVDELLQIIAACGSRIEHRDRPQLAGA
jgi:CRISPR-associated Cas5-like protein